MSRPQSKKRAFRQGRQASTPSYPTMEPELGRRGFLAKLGALVGAAALGGTAAACGSRPVQQTSDGSPWVSADAGGAPMPDAQIDTMPPPQGVAPMMDAGVDMQPPSFPDMGGAPMPDAQIDQQVPSSDGAKPHNDGN
jgi:hypothetical protein